MSQERAIQIARDYLAEKKIETTGHIIALSAYHWHHYDTRGRWGVK